MGYLEENQTIFGEEYMANSIQNHVQRILGCFRPAELEQLQVPAPTLSEYQREINRVTDEIVRQQIVMGEARFMIQNSSENARESNPYPGLREILYQDPVPEVMSVDLGQMEPRILSMSQERGSPDSTHSPDGNGSRNRTFAQAMAEYFPRELLRQEMERRTSFMDRLNRESLSQPYRIWFGGPLPLLEEFPEPDTFRSITAIEVSEALREHERRTHDHMVDALRYVNGGQYGHRDPLIEVQAEIARIESIPKPRSHHENY